MPRDAIASKNISLAPLQLYGGGNCIFYDVMKIEGTEEYLKSAQNDGKCQNKETQENCLAREYLTKGLEQCSCIPYRLRNYSKQASIYFL